MESSITHSKCIQCETELQSGWPRCPKCLTPATVNERVCPNSDCARVVNSDWKECPYCHQPLSGFLTPESVLSAESGHLRPFVTEGIQQPGSIVQLSNVELPLGAGEKLGEKERYRIVRALGTGGSAAVYQAEDTLVHETMALKIVQTSKGCAESIAEKIFHEYKLHKKIDDTSYIIQTQDPRPCEYKELSLILLPMELADGGTFRSWLNKNTDVQGRCKDGVEYFKQVCMGVRAIHDKSIVHLDIKPDNILIVDGKAKIADFGIGRFLADRYKSNPDQLLRQGVGTPEYMSPEQFYVAHQKSIGPASDIYSLGAVLFELIDGSPPFDGTSIELRKKHLQMPVREIVGDNEHWQQIVQRCLAKEPKNRYLNVDALIKDIDYVMQDLYSCIDVSCPKCSHYNQNKEARVCAKCGCDMSIHFKECPMCLLRNRKDVKNCNRCEFDIGLYNLSLARWDRIQRLKDEDLAETLNILGVVLREGIDILDAGAKEQKTNYREKALGLTRELHIKQEKVVPLITSAEKTFVAGNLEASLENWEHILELVPRHRRATEQREILMSAIEEYESDLKSATQLMDGGEFRKAEKLLKRCLEIKPSDLQATEKLKSCRQRWGNFKRAKKQIANSIESKELNTAYAAINEGLSVAPDYHDFLTQKAEVTEKLDNVQKRVAKLNKRFSKGDIEEVDIQLREIEDIQLDNDLAVQLRNNITQVKDAYKHQMDLAGEFAEKLDLSSAIPCVEEAIKLCPHSEEAKTLLQQLEDDTNESSHLIKEAQEKILQADFDTAETIVKQVKNIWATMPAIEDSHERLKKIEQEYLQSKEAAEESAKQGKLDESIGLAQAALAVCPKSSTVKSFIQMRKSEQEKANNLISDAISLISSAQFKQAVAIINKAKSLWATMPDIAEISRTLSEVQKEYCCYIENAKKLADSGELDKAIEQVQHAVEKCQQSQEAKSQFKSLKQKQQECFDLVKNAIALIPSAKFDEAETLLNQVKDIWPTMDSLKDARQKIQKTKKEYNECLQNASKYKTSGKIEKAIEQSNLASELCPESKEPKSIVEQIKEQQKKAVGLIKEAENEILSAGFVKANSLLTSVDKIWKNMSDANKLSVKLKQTQSEYTGYVENFEALLKSCNFDEALNSINMARKLCPNSKQAELLLGQINKALFNKLIRESTGLLEEAKFTEAEQLIRQARELCSDNDDIKQVKSKLNNTRDKYNSHLKQSYIEGTIKNFAAAVVALKKAKQICPKSKEPDKRVAAIKSARTKWRNRKKAYEEFKALVVAWFWIIISTLAGTFVLFQNDHGILLAVVGLSLMACVVNLVINTKLYMTIYGWKNIKSNAESFLLLNGIILSCTGLLIVILPRDELAIIVPLGLILYAFTMPVFLHLKRVLRKLYQVIKSFNWRIILWSLLTIGLLSFLVLVLVSDSGILVDFRKSVGSKVVYAYESIADLFIDEPVINNDVIAKNQFNDNFAVKKPSTNLISKQNIVNEKFTALVKRGNDSYNEGKLETAHKLYLDALQLNFDKDINTRVATIKGKLENYKQYLDAGNRESVDIKNAKAALTQYQKARSQWNSKEINDAIRKLNGRVNEAIDKNLKQAGTLISKGDEEAAFIKANYALRLAEQMELKDIIKKINTVLSQINGGINPGNLSWHKIISEEAACVNKFGDKQNIKIRYYYNPAGMKFVYIKPSDTSGRKIRSGFYIGAAEVTYAQYKSIMGKAPGWFKGNNLPVAGVSWNDAMEFCGKLSKKDGLRYSLPSEKQWEYACTAALNAKYYCGTITDSFANFSPNSGNISTMPKNICSYPANDRGIYDMHGNISEWCRDKDGELRRVLKGGSYRDGPEKLKVSFNDSDSPRGNTKYYGFRVVVEVK